MKIDNRKKNVITLLALIFSVCAAIIGLRITGRVTIENRTALFYRIIFIGQLICTIALVYLIWHPRGK